MSTGTGKRGCRFTVWRCHVRAPAQDRRRCALSGSSIHANPVLAKFVPASVCANRPDQARPVVPWTSIRFDPDALAAESTVTVFAIVPYRSATPRRTASRLPGYRDDRESGEADGLIAARHWCNDMPCPPATIRFAGCCRGSVRLQWDVSALPSWASVLWRGRAEGFETGVRIHEVLCSF